MKKYKYIVYFKILYNLYLFNALLHLQIEIVNYRGFCSKAITTVESNNYLQGRELFLE